MIHRKFDQLIQDAMGKNGVIITKVTEKGEQLILTCSIDAKAVSVVFPEFDPVKEPEAKVQGFSLSIVRAAIEPQVPFSVLVGRSVVDADVLEGWQLYGNYTTFPASRLVIGDPLSPGTSIANIVSGAW
ncbi:hypothetical protein [Corynebacterium mastitidis]|uniref:hypothetical protein n=1 Tax=Corynebacterium mastitidis TaxID=161890 RepID=UPI0012EA2969|nr:hypothetical protein [Corynebacterium mastitidis]